MSHISVAAACRPLPSLSLYRGPASPDGSGDASPPGLSLDCTLQELYDRYVFPVCRESKAATDTVAQDRESLALWTEITGGPPMRLIDQFLCARFVAELAKRPGKRSEHISPNTVRKHCTHLQFILDRAGPRTRRNRLGLALFAVDPPYFERPKKRAKPPRDAFTFDELGRILEACALAQPTENLLEIDAPIWWDGLANFTYNTGLRIDTIMMSDWSMVDRDEPGWITIPREIFKGGEHGHQLYLNATARSAIEGVAACVAKLGLPEPYRSRLFPWRGWPTSASWLHFCRREILAKSSIPAHRRFGFHGSRKALLTWAASENKELARAIAGHVARDVMDESYVNLEDPEVRRKLRELLNRVPQPGRLRQRELF